MKKVMGAALIMAMVVSLTACGSKKTADEMKPTEGSMPVQTEAKKQDPASDNGKIDVVAGVNADFGGLDPFGTASNVKSTWTPGVYQTLFVLEEYGGEPVSVMADHYERVDDTTFDITIYDYIYDSQGNHITAEDVVYSYEYAKDCGTVTKMYYVDSIKQTGTTVYS